MSVLLEVTGLTKRFPGVLAVNEVTVKIRAGEIVALLGANGAGKSTLMQAMAGLHAHGTYEGEISVDGELLRAARVSDAEAAGVVLIPQEVNVVPDLTVGQNMYLGAEPLRFGFVDDAQMYATAGQALREFGVDADPRSRMGLHDLATQQLVVIARALSKRARVLILDEPTAALTEHEARRLFARMRSLRDRGVACIFVSHRLAEVFAVSDRILVMRDGRLRGDHRTEETTREVVVEEMVGRRVNPVIRRSGARGGVPALAVTDFSAADPDPRKRPRVDDVSFAVDRGEIVGLFGLLGAGTGELAMAIFGAAEGAVRGVVQVDGRTAGISAPHDAIANGIGLMAQDRRTTLVLDQSVADNVAMASLGKLSRRGGILDITAKRKLAQEYVDLLRIRAPSVDTPVSALSGGNQQKVQVARWLAAGARVLLLVDPTRGVDVGARGEINALWQRLAAEGYAIVLASSEAEELVEVCDRILVMREGRIVSEHAGDRVTQDQLLHAAAGF
ncbi:MAG: sugar ABC transporter ATP-binding protein [Actinomycetota bacterium]